MGCPYLESGTRSDVCGASVTMMTPSIEENDDYCSTEEHYRCPLLLARVLRGNARN